MMEVISTANATEGERFQKENVLRDFVRFTWRATRGLKNVAESEGRELVSRLVGVGRLTQDEGDRVLVTLKAKMSASRAVFERRVGVSVRSAAEKILRATASECERMTAEVTGLEKRLDRVRSLRVGR